MVVVLSGSLFPMGKCIWLAETVQVPHYSTVTDTQFLKLYDPMLLTVLNCYLTDLLSEIHMLFLRFLYHNTNNLFQYPEWINESLGRSLTKTELVVKFWLLFVGFGSLAVWPFFFSTFIHLLLICCRCFLKTNCIFTRWSFLNRTCTGTEGFTRVSVFSSSRCAPISNTAISGFIGTWRHYNYEEHVHVME